MEKKEYTTAEFLKLPIEERALLIKSMDAEGKTVWSDKGKTPVTGKEDDDDEEEDNGLAEMEHKDNITEMIDRIGAKKARAIFIDTVLDCAKYVKDAGGEDEAVEALDGATTVDAMAEIAEEYGINTEEMLEEIEEDDDDDSDDNEEDDEEDEDDTVEKSYTSAEVLLMKSIDRSRLVKKQVTDKNGKMTTKWVAPSQPVTGDHGHPSQEHAQAVAMYKDKKRFMSKDKAHAHVAKMIGKEYADYAHMHVGTGKTDTSKFAGAGKKAKNDEDNDSLTAEQHESKAKEHHEKSVDLMNEAMNHHRNGDVELAQSKHEESYRHRRLSREHENKSIELLNAGKNNTYKIGQAISVSGGNLYNDSYSTNRDYKAIVSRLPNKDGKYTIKMKNGDEFLLNESELKNSSDEHDKRAYELREQDAENGHKNLEARKELMRSVKGAIISRNYGGEKRTKMADVTIDHVTGIYFPKRGEPYFQIHGKISKEDSKRLGVSENHTFRMSETELESLSKKMPKVKKSMSLEEVSKIALKDPITRARVQKSLFQHNFNSFITREEEE